MAHDFRGARDSAEARLDSIISPVARAVRGKAGVTERKTPRQRAEERLENGSESGKADRIIGRLRTLSRTELHKVAAAVGDLLDETK